VVTPTRTPPVTEAVEGWRYLVRRPESPYKQLYLKGRSITVGNIVYTMRANKWTPAEVAYQYDLPIEQIEEAIRYYERHRDVVDGDAQEDRRQAEAQGIPIDPPAVPRRLRGQA
jgi:uncharacterized protein (DUF433 family)